MGVFPALLDERPDTVEALVDASVERAAELVGLGPGATVVVTSGRRIAQTGSTNLIQVRRVGAEDD